MKRFYTLLVILCLFNSRGQAQYAQVSLDFYVMIQARYPVESAGIFNSLMDMDTTATFVRTLRHMDIHNYSQNGPQLIRGLQYFDSLEYLDCSGNAIEEITFLPPNLDTLICNDQFWGGSFHWTTLGSLPPLPASLRYLDCSRNYIGGTMTLPPNLTWLNCSGQYYHVSTPDWITVYTNFTSLPSSLKYLKADVDNISFPELPFSMTDLILVAPNMNCIPVLPASMQFLSIDAPNITCIPNAVAGMVQSPVFPVCNGSNNPNSCLSQPVFGALPIITGLRTLPGVASASASYTLYGYNFNSATGNITVSTPTPSLEISTDNTTFSSSPIVIPYTNSQISMPIYVRISNSAPLGPVSANIINSTAGLTDVNVPVSGEVVNPFLEAGPGINQLNGFTGEPSPSLAYTVNAMGLTPAAGSISITSSAGLEVSTDNVNFSSTTLLAYTNATINSTQVYVRLSNPVTAGPFTGTITNSGGAVPDAIVNISGTVSLSGIITGPDITGLSTVLGIASAPVYSSWVTQHVLPINGAGTITASPGLEIDQYNGVYSTTLNVNYSTGTTDNTSVRISSTAPAGPLNGTITYTIPGYADAVVNVSGYVHAPLITAGPSISGLATVAGTASGADIYALSAADLYPSSGNLSLTASAGLELSTDYVNYSSAVVVPYTGGALGAMTVFVRVSATAPIGAINGTITNSGGGASDAVVNVNGNVTAAPMGYLSAGPVNISLSTTAGVASTAEIYQVSAVGLNPTIGPLEITASPNLEISEDNVNFSSSISTIYQSNTFSETIYVRISNTAPVGPISGIITNSAIGAGVPDAIVNVNGIVNAAPSPVITAGPDISGLNTQSGTASAATSYSLSGNDLSPASGNITVTASSFLEVSTDNTNFSSLLSVPYSSGLLAGATIYVRISSSATVGTVNGTITNSGGGASDVIVSVSGNVSSAVLPVITAAPDITGLSASGGNASAAQTYTLSASDLVPATGDLTVTASSSLEVSTDNTNFSSSLLVPYNSGQLAATTMYVRIAAGTATGTVSGTITNSGGGASDAVVQVSGNSARPAGISIGPNPTRDMVTVYLPGNAATIAVSIVNGNGQTVKTISTNKESVQIFISNLSRGIYTIRLVGENITETRRLMIN